MVVNQVSETRDERDRKKISRMSSKTINSEEYLVKLSASELSKKFPS